LDKPGLYNGRIEAIRADKTKIPEFDIMTTLVVPYEFNTDNNYSLSFEKEKIEPGMHKRYFLKIPYGATSLKINIQSQKNVHTSLRYYLHDPDGREKLFNYISAVSDDISKSENFHDLVPGVYEFVVLGQYTSAKESIYNIDFEVDGINILGHSIIDEKLSIANYLSKANSYTLNSRVIGSQETINVNLVNDTKYEIPFTLDENDNKITFDVSLDKGVFNKVTDFALMILDEEGKAVKTGAFAYKDQSITLNRIPKNGNEKFNFVMIPGFAHEPSDISFKIVKTKYLKNAIESNVTNNRKKTITIYPDVNYNLNFDLKLPNTKLNDGESFINELSFISTKTKNVEFTKIIPIKK
jgi:hypothetical protein